MGNGIFLKIRKLHAKRGFETLFGQDTNPWVNICWEYEN
jgi:hypothetical protein